MEIISNEYDPAAWARLGALLKARRREMGYRYRPAFGRDRGLNDKMSADIENNYRPNTWPELTLHEIAAAYQVTTDSLFAVLRGEAVALEPLSRPVLPGQDTARGRVPVTDAFSDLAGSGLDHYRYVVARDLGARPPRLRNATERRIWAIPDSLMSPDQKRALIAGLRWALDMADQQGESSG